MAEAHITKKKYWQVFAWLMGLLFLTVFVAYMHIDPWWAIIVAMTIAITKAVLVILYFMHVRYNSKLTWLFVASGFFWLLIMVGIIMTDYKTRDWDPSGYAEKPTTFSSPSKLPANMFPQNEPGAAGHGEGAEHGENAGAAHE
ncbi:MAG: cytochrome C oxidase subunit IV family protein [Candidatus Kapaibacterium sp.]